MKHHLRNICLSAALCSCFMTADMMAENEVILPVSALVALQHQDLPSGDFLNKLPEVQMQVLNSAQSDLIFQAMSDYTAPETSLIVNRSDYFYYYEQLQPLEKEMYDIMLEIAKDPVSENNYGLLITDQDPVTNDFMYSYYCALLALTYDHPELFWLYNESETSIMPSSDVTQVNGRYMVFFGMEKPFANYTTEMTAFNHAVDMFLADIDQSGSQYDTAKQIHDKLIDLVTYNTPVMEGGMDEFGNLGHTAYAALVADSSGNPNYAVCDGYSLAYEYLLQQCGIPAVFMGGNAGFSPFSLGGHAWNMVMLDGIWYEADSTWDDAGTTEDQLDPQDEWYDLQMEGLYDPAYREMLQHFLFMVSSETMGHYVPDEETKWYMSEKYEMGFSFLGECWHERMEEDSLLSNRNPQGGVISLAPVAETNYAA